MEFSDRVVEHLLVPARKHLPNWSSYSAFEGTATTSGGTVLRLNDEIVEFLEYAWAAYAGTGGELPFTGNWLLEPTVSEYAVVVDSGQSVAVDPDVKVTSDQLASIKAAFGLSISQLAQVLRVKRPTIYAWLDSENGPSALRNSNRDRLVTLNHFAEIWNRSSHVPPAQLLNATLKDGSTLLELLSDSKLNHDRIVSAIRTLTKGAKAAAESMSLTERLRKKGFADAPSSPTMPRRSKK